MDPRGPRTFTMYVPHLVLERYSAISAFNYIHLSKSEDYLEHIWTQMEKEIFYEVLNVQKEHPEYHYGSIERIKPSAAEIMHVRDASPMELVNKSLRFSVRIVAYKPIAIDADKYDAAIIVSALSRLKKILRDKETDSDVLKPFKAALRDDIVLLFGEAAKAVFES